MSDAPQKPGKSSDLAVRAGVGLALIALAGTALWLGGILFWLMCTAAAILMLEEWGRLFRVPEQPLRAAQLVAFITLFMLTRWEAAIGPAGLGVVLIGAGVTWLATRTRMLALGMLYVGVPVLGLLILRQEGASYAFWAMALVWASDIGAYFAGRLLGGPKLAPSISPNKTWAGAVMGVAAAAIFARSMHETVGLPWALVFATPVLAIVSQFGDLFESWLKRRAGVKDSGSLLPGHGGLLDRLDGLVPVAPLAAAMFLVQKSWL